MATPISTFPSMASLPLATTSTVSTTVDTTQFNSTTNIRRTLLIKPPAGTRRDGYRSYFHSISFLSRQGRVREALGLLNDMEMKSYLPGQEIYSELLQGCVTNKDVPTGQQLHARIVKNGALYSANEYIETKLVIFYAKCDMSEAADTLFHRLQSETPFSWAAIIGLRSRMGDNVGAVNCLCKMVENGLFIDNFVAPNVLKACGGLQWIECGRAVHGLSIKIGLDACVYVSSSLVDMYSKCGVLEDARKVFDGMPERNTVTWNSMISGYAQNGFNEEAIDMFLEMRLDDFEPTVVTLLSLLSASANLCAVEEGKQGHSLAVRCGFALDKIMGSSILNFYSKLGLIEDVELIFDTMLDQDEVTWNLLISSYVRVFESDNALGTCRSMRLANLRFDAVTLASVLSVCSHTKNLTLGKEAHCFCLRNRLCSDMVVASGIVDMYTKCGRIGDAVRVFEFTMNGETNIVLWNTMLTAYVDSGHIGQALKLFYRMELDSVPHDVTSWNAVVVGFLKNGELDEAKYMFSKMQSAGIAPNSTTLMTLISGLVRNCRGGECSDIGSLVRKVEESGVRSNVLNIITTCSGDSTLFRDLKAIYGFVLRHYL